MAKTEIWDDFGESILAWPDLTLAAILGHEPSMIHARQRSILFPTKSDFQADRTYDPNPHKLKLAAEELDSTFLMRCVSTWGAEPLMRAVNACSQLQCERHGSCSPQILPLRTETARALQVLIDAPSPASRRQANEVLLKCKAAYRQYEKSPDSAEARQVWYHLGAPWFGLETATGDLAARSDCGETEPAPSNASWCARTTVWPVRAIDAAAHWSSHVIAQEAIRMALISWAVSHDEWNHTVQRESR